MLARCARLRVARVSLGFALASPADGRARSNGPCGHGDCARRHRRARKDAVSLVWFILLIGGLITVHELGHFLAARLLDIKVLKVSIGFGPALFSPSPRRHRVRALVDSARRLRAAPRRGRPGGARGAAPRLRPPPGVAAAGGDPGRPAGQPDLPHLPVHPPLRAEGERALAHHRRGVRGPTRGRGRSASRRQGDRGRRRHRADLGGAQRSHPPFARARAAAHGRARPAWTGR